MARGVVKGSGASIVVNGTRDLQGGIEILLGFMNEAFGLLDRHARQIVVCQCGPCGQNREAGARIANIIIENRDCGLFPPDLIATARAFNRGQSAPAGSPLEVAR